MRQSANRRSCRLGVLLSPDAALTSHASDPRWARPAKYNPLEALGVSLIRDERDLIFVRMAALISVVLIPGAVLMVLAPSWLTLALTVPWLALVYGGFGGRYMLMLHAVCHRRLFKKDYSLLDKWIPWVLGPFFGSTPTSFYAHHMGMHHPENNLATDLSTTLPYKRDYLPHFLHYWARFFFCGYANVTRYLVNHHKTPLARSFVIGEISWFIAFFTMLYIDWAAAIVVMLLPLLMIRWFMMCGNFAQHAFVDIDDANNPYKNSTCLTNTVYNHKCYNDGYHIVHHIKPNLHWSEMADWYKDNQAEFAAQDALVFDGLRNNQAVWWLLMRQDYDTLAKHVVNFHGRTHEELVVWLKSRVQRQSGTIPGMLSLS